MKRTLSLILAVLILVSVFGVPAAYAEDTDPSQLAPVAASEQDEPENPDTPRVEIVTNDNVGLKLKKADGYVGATVTVTDTNGEQVGGEAQVKIRGNSTSALNKKSYTFKFTKKVDVLGMGKAKKWAVVANMFDPTLLRNQIAFDIADNFGLEYTSRHRIVEVWMDDSFRGCYLLAEPIQEGKTRVDIDIESNGGKKDFLIEREYNHIDAGKVYFKTNGIRFVCGDPEEPDDEQLAYIQSTMDGIIDILKNGTRAEIEAAIDVPSFAKYYLLNEFVKDVDFDYSSVFFYYKDGRLYAGPAWDYDLSMGNEDPENSANAAAANRTDGIFCNNMHLYKWLCTRDWFFDAVYRVYAENSAYLDAVGAEGGMIDTLYSTYQAPIDRNFTVARWGFTNYYLNRKPDNNYPDNLTYLKTWCSERAAWLKGWFTEGVAAHLIGDSNANEEVDIVDATLIQRYLAEFETEVFDAKAADTDADDVITIFDATYIQLFLVDLPSTSYINRQMYLKQ